MTIMFDMVPVPDITDRDRLTQEERQESFRLEFDTKMVCMQAGEIALYLQQIHMVCIATYMY